MIAVITIVVGSFLLTGCAAYAAWCDIRVRLFRQQMFAIRNQMFDKAVASGTLDHPHYLEARQSMNRLIRFAPLISTGMMKRVFAAAGEVPARKGERLPFVDAATREFSTCVMNYVLLWTASGWLEMVGIFLSRGPREAARQTVQREAKDLRRAMRSPAIDAVDDIPSHVCPI